MPEPVRPIFALRRSADSNHFLGDQEHSREPRLPQPAASGGQPRWWWLLSLSLLVITSPAWAGPTVVPTIAGQFGETPGATDEVIGTRFESIRGVPNDVVLGGIFDPNGTPPEAQFLTDMINGYPDPVPIDSDLLDFTIVAKQPMSSARSRNTADNGDFVAFSFALDGTEPETFTVRIATFDENGTRQADIPIVNVPTFPLADPSLTKTGVAVDNQGRVTVVYTELEGGTSRILGRRFNTDGTVVNPEFEINTDGNHLWTDVALLDPAGNRMIVTTVEQTATIEIKGNIIDFSSGVPVVDPDFLISDTAAAFGNLAPVVAANLTTGVFTAVWEHTTAVQGDPIDVRARRFDADGNPIGGDFRVNSTTAEVQAQPSVAYGASGDSVIAWAADASVQGDELDVFFQVYDAQGNPIGGETRANSTTTEVQDRPQVRFLPETDNLGQPQFVVTWRDVGVADGTQARGTGQSYQAFSIGGEDPTMIFADGFESGDTSSWSDQQP